MQLEKYHESIGKMSQYYKYGFLQVLEMFLHFFIWYGVHVKN